MPALFFSLKVYLLPTSLLAAEESVPANVTDEAQQKTRSTVKIKAERCVQIEKALHHFNTDLTRMSSYGTDADISIVLKSYENALTGIQQLEDKYVNNLRTSDTQR